MDVIPIDTFNSIIEISPRYFSPLYSWSSATMFYADVNAEKIKKN